MDTAYLDQRSKLTRYPVLVSCIPPHHHAHVLAPRDHAMPLTNTSTSFTDPPSPTVTGNVYPSSITCCNKNELHIVNILDHSLEKQDHAVWIDEKQGAHRVTGSLLPFAHSPRANISHKSSRPFIARLLRVSLALFGCFQLYRIFIASCTTASSLAVPSLSAAFTAKCEALLEPEPTTYTSRLTKLVSALQTSEVPLAWVAEPGPSAEYFIGAFTTKQWWLSERPFLVAVTPGTDGVTPNITLLTPAFEQLRAELIPLPDQVKALVTFVPWAESQSPYDTLLEYLGRPSVVVDAQVRTFISEGLSVGGGDIGGKVKNAVTLIRQRKDTRELGLLRCANEMTLHAIRKTRAQMHFGITESVTRKILEREMAAVGLVGGDGLVLFGENAALPHGSGTDRALGKADFVLIDAGGRFGGYVSDITRTFALPGSKISAAHLEVWETVRQAQVAPSLYLATTNVTSPPSLATLDRVSRDLVSERMAALGVNPAPTGPDYTVFTHRLGHGIGLEGHEGPYVVQGPLGSHPVFPGHVFSQEPGVYIPINTEQATGDIPDDILGVGVRIEDCFVVTVDDDGVLGGEWLSGPVSKWGDI